MSVLVWAGQHRLWTLGIGIVAVLAAVAAGVWFFVLKSPGTQIDLRQALRLYREDEGDGAGGGRLPPAGVYAYRTTGGEELSFGDIGRQFPSATQMIVTDGGGCTTMRWVPLEQHTESLAVCPRPDGAYRVRSMSSYEMIAGVQTTTVIQCPEDAYLVPPDPSAGRRWHATCSTTGHQKVTLSGLVVGPSSVDVGDRELPALHTRLTLGFSGGESGTNPNDYWLSDGDALVLRQRESVDLSQDAGPLGSVHYGETMAIGLRSLEPVR